MHSPNKHGPPYEVVAVASAQPLIVFQLPSG